MVEKILLKSSYNKDTDLHWFGSSGSGSLFGIRNLDPGSKFTNKPDFQPFKKAFVLKYLCFMTDYIKYIFVINSTSSEGSGSASTRIGSFPWILIRIRNGVKGGPGVALKPMRIHNTDRNHMNNIPFYRYIQREDSGTRYHRVVRVRLKPSTGTYPIRATAVSIARSWAAPAKATIPSLYHSTKLCPSPTPLLQLNWASARSGPALFWGIQNTNNPTCK